jgi:hypothetical protein
MSRKQIWLWGSVIAFLVLVPLGTMFIMSRFFTDYREVATSWEPAQVSADGRVITVEYVTSQPGCGSFDRVERSETPSTVTLKVILSKGSRGGCDSIAVYEKTEVELSRPLGQRKLLDGRTGREPGFFSQPIGSSSSR